MVYAFFYLINLNCLYKQFKSYLLLCFLVKNLNQKQAKNTVR